MNILGLSAFYHDSAAALIQDGVIVAAAQEERFSRKKFDPNMPLRSIQFCLEKSKLQIQDIEALVFYDKPLIKFERLLETYFSFSPRGLKSFIKSMPIWLKQKLFLKNLIRKQLSEKFKLDIDDLPQLCFAEHHESHAASAYYPSPYDNAAVLCLDGVGEWATTSAWLGQGNKLAPLWEIDFPHSLGLLYSAFTYYAGFSVNSGEYKLMGLAPYGEPKYVSTILDNLIDLKDDGSFRLNMKYFDFATGLKMTNNKFGRLFGMRKRDPESDFSQVYMDVAASIQRVTEEIVLRLAHTLYDQTKSANLCMAGGVALNCVANGKLLREGPFRNIWIQPAAGDSGGAIGAALQYWHFYKEKERKANPVDGMNGSYLGPDYSDDEIELYLDSIKAPYEKFSTKTKLDEQAFYRYVANLLSQQKVVGWFQGRMEFGPRALGNRSILGDPRGQDTQTLVNLKIKFRESFRPFAPSVLESRARDYFDLPKPSPYMLLVAEIHDSQKVELKESENKHTGIDKLKVVRSTIPAVTHVDCSARVQTVNEKSNEKYYKLIKAFEQQTACPVILNTSFNVRGEPIVCSPLDAYQCFMRTRIDYLVLGNYVLDKREQPDWQEEGDWRDEFELD